MKLYEQVARDFRDQRDPAATANTRLAALRQGAHPAAPATMTQRRIELPDPTADVSAYLQTDGQRVVFKDSATGELMMSDLAGRSKRVIFRPKEGTVANFVLSRDSSLVIAALNKPDSTRTFAAIRTDGTGFRDIPDLHSCSPNFEVSWDNRYVLSCQPSPGGPKQLVRVSVVDGEARTIREADGINYRFSPDGNFIAYNVSPGQLFVVPSQGGEPQLVADRGSFLDDWTRDGRYLIIDVTSGGARALNLVPIKDGRQAGKPVFARYGNFMAGRTAASGALIYGATPQDGQYTPWLGTLAPANGSVGWKKLSLSGSNQGPSYPTWSPDSTQIAYVTHNGAAGQYSETVRVRTLASSDERELYHSDLPTGCLWSLQHPSLFCGQRGTRLTAFSISTDTGQVEPLGAVPPGVDFDAMPLVLADKDRVVYLVSQKQGLIRWEIGAAQSSTAVENASVTLSTRSTYLTSLSPDARWVTRWMRGNIEIRPMSGGDWRVLAPVERQAQDAFTADGNWFFYHGKDAAGKDGLFRVATSGGQPERLGDFPAGDMRGYMWISPDGKKIIADSFNPEELWMLQNFEPKQQAAK